MTAARPARLPRFDAAACVLDRLPAASCTACADACPRKALAATPEGLELELDPAACTGCGGCAAVCPEAAAALDMPMPPVRDGTVAIRCGGPADPGAPGCLHGLGLERLARLRLSGARRIALATGDCAACANGPSPFAERLGCLNRLLADRGLPPLAARPATAAERAAEGPDPARRALFGRLAALAAPEPEGSALARLQALPPRGGTPARFAHVPVIDAARCSGCGACVRLCPHGVLTRINDAAGTAAYDCAPAACTGCGLCMDICEEAAIRIGTMTEPPPPVALTRFRCRACGAGTHVPAGRTPEGGLCRVCARSGHHRKLFQVWT